MQLAQTTNFAGPGVQSEVPRIKNTGAGKLANAGPGFIKRFDIRARLHVGFAVLLLQMLLLTAVGAVSLIRAGSSAAIYLMTLGGASVLLGLAVGYWLAKSLSSSLGNVRAAVQRMAAGDLTEPVAGDAAGSGLGELQQALQKLSERLFKTVAEVRMGTVAVATTSAVISSDNASLSSRTEAQASSLEETSSTMEELTSTVKQNADNAQLANRLAIGALEQAETGGRAVGDVVRTMDIIKESSARIADIIGVIDGIAFQTNILALNAAVEAARAGSEGRGFAVVASAVRELAQRSAESAKEIKAVISESVSLADAGSLQVAAAGKTIAAAVDSVRNVTTIMNEIAQACAEQSTGIDEINRAIVHIDGVTQKNALLVEESVKTAAGLHEQAVALLDSVSAFRLGAREFGNADDAVRLVKQAGAYMRAHGADALIDDVLTLRKSRFIDRDLYLSINDIDGKCVANGSNLRVVGADGTQTRDSDGKYFVREILALAKRDGSGWTDYRYPHPVTKVPHMKSTYFEKVDKLIISCGFYKDIR